MGQGIHVDVYPTDAEAFEAAAALAATHLGTSGARPTVALAGGRGGRGVMVALAARSDVPWARVEWFWGDERCVPADDPRSNVRLARDSLFLSRGVAAAAIHPPPVELDDPERIAAAYGETLATGLSAGPAPVFDLVLLGVGTNGHTASLMPGSRALRATTPVAAVVLEEVSEDPLVARITVTPPLLAAARHVIVTVTGAAKAKVVARVLAGTLEPEHLPAQLVRPDDRVTWVIDRAAAAELLRDAQPAPDQ
jgi:6-phosphogluconolactonase